MYTVYDASLSCLMKIATESPEKLTDSDLEDIVDTWKRKCIDEELFIGSTIHYCVVSEVGHC